MSREWFLNGHPFRIRTFELGVEVAQKVYFSTKELHTNYVKRDGAIYGLKTGELCMDFKKTVKCDDKSPIGIIGLFTVEFLVGRGQANSFF